MKAEITQEGLKTTPPVAVMAWTWMHGVTLNEIVALATLGYIVLQAAYLIWKWIREYKRGRK